MDDDDDLEGSLNQVRSIMQGTKAPEFDPNEGIPSDEEHMIPVSMPSEDWKKTRMNLTPITNFSNFHGHMRCSSEKTFSIR